VIQPQSSLQDVLNCSVFYTYLSKTRWKSIGKGIIWPLLPTQKPLNRSWPELAKMWVGRGYLPMCNIYPDRFRVIWECVILCPPPVKKWLGYFGGSWERYRRDAHTYFEANYVKRRGSVHRSAFWFRPPFSKNPAIFGPRLDWINIGRSESKRCIYSKSCIVNRQIWVWIKKKCFYFDPYSLVT